MGTTYHARFEKSREVEAFDVNSWGRDLLGDLHEKLGLPVSEEETLERRKMFELPARAPYTATAAEAKAMAAQLAAKTDAEILAVHTAREGRGWGDTPEEYVKWARRWQNFLATCGGYRADS